MNNWGHSLTYRGFNAIYNYSRGPPCRHPNASSRIVTFDSDLFVCIKPDGKFDRQVLGLLIGVIVPLEGWVLVKPQKRTKTIAPGYGEWWFQCVFCLFSLLPLKLGQLSGKFVVWGPVVWIPGILL